MDFSSRTDEPEGLNGRILARVSKELELIQDVLKPMLVLNSLCLTSIPDMILCNDHCIKNLRELCLKSNQITSLPKEVSNLHALCKLHLPTNNLEQLPDVLADLPSLRVLDISNNLVSSISPSVAKMKVLEDLNLGNNRLTSLPDELWKIPSLCCFNAQGNQLKAISSEVVHCQSLSKLILDCNDLTTLPMQVTKLPNLKYLSLAGNMLQSLPIDFSENNMLQSMLVDMNPGLSCIPVSLAPLSWWGTLGIEGCSVHVKREDLSFLKPLNTCSPVPSLTELTARFLHSVLKISLRGSVSLWLPDTLCSALQLPQGLRSWLVPSGKCPQNCQNVYFRHHYAMLLSGQFYKKLDAKGRCKPDDLALRVNCCSLQCAKSYFTVF